MRFKPTKTVYKQRVNMERKSIKKHFPPETQWKQPDKLK